MNLGLTAPPARPALRVLWTVPYVPYPATNGGKQRQMGLLTQLARRGHAITLLCHAKEMPDAATRTHLEGLLDRVIVLARPGRAGPRRLLRAALAWRRPAIATINGCNAAFEASFARLLGENFDIVQVEHSYAFEPFRRPLERTGLPFVLTEHNVESDVVRFHYLQLPRLLRPLGALDALRGRMWERDVIRRAACVVAVAAPDEPRFAAMGARATALVVNAIDVDAYAHVVPDRGRRTALFLGNYEYTPNVDAVAWLCDDILPIVWRQEPDLRLAVRGHAMPAHWRARWPDPRIAFDGYAASIPAAHAEASLFVAPLRFGGGSKLKVLEAMASSLPVVATPEAMTGITVAEGEGYICGRNAEQFAAGMVRCLRAPDAAAAIGVRARAHVASHHDWAAAARALERAWQGVMRQAGDHVHASPVHASPVHASPVHASPLHGSHVHA